MWQELTSQINSEVCSDENDLSNEVRRAWDSISMEHVNNLVDGHDERFRGVAALRGECLNGHRDAFKDLRPGIPLTSLP
jgi:high-affinity K+ transport system ATPase subunit B